MKPDCGNCRHRDPKPERWWFVCRETHMWMSLLGEASCAVEHRGVFLNEVCSRWRWDGQVPKAEAVGRRA